MYTAIFLNKKKHLIQMSIIKFQTHLLKSLFNDIKNVFFMDSCTKIFVMISFGNK